MIELVRAAAAAQPDHTAVLTSAREVSYAELLRLAETAAGALRARGVTRFAVLDPDPVSVWALVAAAALVGAEPCVYPVAAEPATVVELRERLGHDVIVSAQLEDGPGVVRPGELLDAGDRVTDRAPEDSRILVLTTGTSGHARAAQHEWSRLLRVTRRIEPTPHHRWLLAYGLNQFGGLQILIHVSAAHATLAAADALTPRAGLEAMRRWGVTHASGTPTFWRFVLAEIAADGQAPPPLRQVTLGGEAVPPVLLANLGSQFPDARISQVYGATEMGQNITVRDGRAGLPMSVLDEGGDVVFKIVDNELWVRTKSSMLGYVGGDRIDVDGWRATGDLVEIVDDRIMFRGRVSEVINVGGVKVHPLPIEARVSEVSGVALAHVFGRPSALVGSIVALEVVPDRGADVEAVRAAIREACADMPPAMRPRSITFVDTLHTTGNKVSRGNRA